MNGFQLSLQQVEHRECRGWKRNCVMHCVFIPRSPPLSLLFPCPSLSPLQTLVWVSNPTCGRTMANRVRVGGTVFMKAVTFTNEDTSWHCSMICAVDVALVSSSGRDWDLFSWHSTAIALTLRSSSCSPYYVVASTVIEIAAKYSTFNDVFSSASSRHEC